MQAPDRVQFAECFNAIGDLYGKRMSKSLMDIYWQALNRFELCEIQCALQAHVNNPDGGQFLPKPADIVRFIDGAGQTRALHAWTKVEKAIVAIGRYQSIAFDDALIHAVIDDMGGWVMLCSTRMDALPFRANDFQIRYKGYLRTPPERHPRYLCGVLARDNDSVALFCQLPMLVGDPGKAKQVMRSGCCCTLPVAVLSQSRHK